jgi:hypothetical protein
MEKRIQELEDEIENLENMNEGLILRAINWAKGS